MSKHFRNFWPANLHFQKKFVVGRDCTVDQVGSDRLITGEKAGSWLNLVFQKYNNLFVSTKSVTGKILFSNLIFFVDSNSYRLKEAFKAQLICFSNDTKSFFSIF